VIAVKNLCDPYAVSWFYSKINDSLRTVETRASTGATDTPWWARKRWLQHGLTPEGLPGSGLVFPMGRDRGLGLFDGLGISQVQRPAARCLGIRL
jgi:hypothetical protein